MWNGLTIFDTPIDCNNSLIIPVLVSVHVFSGVGAADDRHDTGCHHNMLDILSVLSSRM